MIVQNNDYSVINNNIRNYNYNFNDTGTIYSAEGMFSDLSLSTTIPGRISQRVFQMISAVSSALGVEGLKSVMQVTSGSSFGQFCIENPLGNVGNGKVLPIRACVDFDELAGSSHMQMIRMVLLFMVFFTFISAVFTVLRQY
jgi:hypothetical protein